MENKQIIKKETLFVTYGHLILSIVMQTVFAIYFGFDFRTVTANSVSSFISILNFHLMSLSVEKAVGKTDPEEAKKIMKASQSIRMLFIGSVIIICSIFNKFFNIYALLIPLLFTRITVTVRAFTIKKGTTTADEK